MAQNLMTPGVYIEEKSAFPGSVVEVATAIPAFIGYTQKASRNGKSLINQPTRVTSFAEYLTLFGGAFSPTFTLGEPTDEDRSTVVLGGTEKSIKFSENNNLLFYNSIRLFYSNGGGTCYIVSVGTYGDKDSLVISKDELLGTSKDDKDRPIEGGLQKLVKEQEPTIIVIPEAVNLGEDCYEVYKQMLAHCSKMQNRVAIFDVHDGFNSRDGEEDNINTFREKIGTEYLSYGATYYPWLETNVVQKGEITFKNLEDSVQLGELLPEERAKTLI